MRVSEEKSQRFAPFDHRQDPADWSGARRSGHSGGVILKVGARSSPLSRVQVEEVMRQIDVTYSVIWVESTGDKDKKTSLRGLGKSNFFTKELDEMLLEKKIDCAIHSAKDLPEPISKGLVVAALTKGLDPRDSLVFKKELKTGGVVATSSERREDQVRVIRPDLTFVDLRGTIGERLEKLERGEVDGVVVAEAALIRLGLTHLERIFLPGETAQGQGQLAVLAHEDNQLLRQLFESYTLV